MSLNFLCKKCGAELSVAADQAGHDVSCDKCGKEQFAPLGENLIVGNLINDYMITGELGEGTMGRVFKAHHLLMDREVALKTIKDQADDEARSQFISEMQSMAGLDHPNIISVYDAGEKNDIAYITMQLLKGFDLKEMIEQQGPLTVEEAMPILISVAKALDYAWNEKRMTHRDIKPENIFLTEQGDVKVMDFGLAKSTAVHEAGDSYDGLIVGTPDFMSPEQGRGGDNVDFRSDIYSLGILMVYLVTAKRPFHSHDPMEVVASHLTEKLPEFETLNPEAKVTPAFRLLVRKMTNKDRNERYASWQECLSAAMDAIQASSEKESLPGATVKKRQIKRGKNLKTSTDKKPVETRRPEIKRRKKSIMKPIVIMLFLIGLILGGSWFALPQEYKDKIFEKFSTPAKESSREAVKS